MPTIWENLIIRTLSLIFDFFFSLLFAFFVIFVLIFFWVLVEIQFIPIAIGDTIAFLSATAQILFACRCKQCI